MAEERNLPAAGMYRTLYPHPENAQAVPARTLTYFSPTSDQGPPVVLIPDSRTGRVWNFGKQGVLTKDEAWLQTLVPLEPQGYYMLRRELVIGAGQKLPVGLLVFLSYSPQGEPTIYPGVSVKDQNIAFALDAIPISDLQLNALSPLDFTLAQEQPPPNRTN